MGCICFYTWRGLRGLPVRLWIYTHELLRYGETGPVSPCCPQRGPEHHDVFFFIFKKCGVHSLQRTAGPDSWRHYHINFTPNVPGSHLQCSSTLQHYASTGPRGIMGKLLCWQFQSLGLAAQGIGWPREKNQSFQLHHLSPLP